MKEKTKNALSVYVGLIIAGLVIAFVIVDVPGAIQTTIPALAGAGLMQFYIN